VATWDKNTGLGWPHGIRILDLGGPHGIRILDFKMLQCMLRKQDVEYVNRIHLAQDRKQWRASYE
jgi:hypothetical protein